MLKTPVMMNSSCVIAAKERIKFIKKTKKRFGEGGRRRRTIDCVQKKVNLLN